MKLILGSASPRRRELLGQLGILPDRVVSPDIDETPELGELPRAYCRRMAEGKLARISVGEGEVALSADTTVALGRRILGKPKDKREAAGFLKLMSGRRHRVITAVAVKTGSHDYFRDNVTVVKLRQLTEADIAGYIARGDWQGKAGGYAIQGPAAAFIPWIQGSYSGVMGLPLAETAALLSAAGLEVGR